MTMTLTEDQQRRLIRILNMLGSAHDGEVLNAARQAQKFLGSLGMTTWEEVVLHNGARWTDDDVSAVKSAAFKDGYAAHETDAKAEALEAFADADSCPAFAQLCLRNYRDRLNDWEIDFCRSWSVKPEYIIPSDKQRAVFQRLARKVHLTPP
jgi:hypothetical protein